MGFEWDEAKRHQNIQKHGIDFEDVKAAFNELMLTRVDDRQDYGEDRWIGVGTIHGIPIVIAYSEPNEETIRIISARKATKNERENFHKAIKNRLA